MAHWSTQIDPTPQYYQIFVSQSRFIVDVKTKSCEGEQQTNVIVRMPRIGYKTLADAVKEDLCLIVDYFITGMAY